MKLYTFDDPYIAEAIWADAFEDFCEIVSDEPYWKEYDFVSERDANTFIYGMTWNEDERSMPRYGMLLSDTPEHWRYIDYIESI